MTYNHVWGESLAADYVRSRVSGVSDWEKYNFMVLQAYIDDSWDKDRKKVLVLAGYVASAPAWTEFSKEWAAHLKTHDLKSFKLSSMPNSRPEYVASFYRILENHDIPLSIDCTLDIALWEKVTSEVVWPKNSETMQALIHNPWFITSKKLMQALFTQAQNLGFDGPIDLMFDEQEAEKKIVWDAWDFFKKTMPDDSAKYIGSTPSFLNDELFNPLQAADLIVGSIRRGYEKGIRLPNMDIFSPWKPSKESKMKRLGIELPEHFLKQELAWILSQENFEQAKASFSSQAS